MKTMLKRKKSGSQRAAIGSVPLANCARNLQRRLPGLGATVAEENAVQSAHLGQAQRKFGCTLMEEEI